VLPSVWQVFISQGKEQEEAMVPAIENLKFLEQQLKGQKFFGGDTIGLLDLAVGLMANLVSIWEALSGLKLIVEEKFPHLSTWMQDFSDVPVIKENWPPRERMITKFQVMLEPYLAAAANNMAEEVKLFRTWTSPFALRIVWALKLKAIEFDTIFEDFPNKSALLLEYNPVHKRVPVLVHNGNSIGELLVIIEYIEETWRENPLLPEDPYEKAMARFWVKFSDDKVLPSVWQVFISQGKEQEEAMVPAIENLKFLEQQLKGQKFFGGDTIGLLDLAVGLMANLVSIWEALSGLKLIVEEKFPHLSTWMQDFSDVPVIKENWPPRERMITKFQVMLEPYLAAAANKVGMEEGGTRPKVLPSVWHVYFKQGKEQEEATATAMENLKLLEEQLKGKKFFGGETIGYLDIAVGWMANLVSILEEVVGLKVIDEEKNPLLSTWMQDFSDVPVIKENWPPREELITKFHVMRETYLTAAAKK
ncbi:hypothetical protein RJ639_013914, partial [Escallonia herrerae]